MQIHSDPDRVAFMPETDEEAEILLDVFDGTRETEELMAWTTCDGAEYDDLDAKIEDNVLVLSSRPTPSSTWDLSTVVSVVDEVLLYVLALIGAAVCWRWVLE